MQRLVKQLAVVGGAVAAGGYAVQSVIRKARWFEFDGKVVVITGASRGLGLVLARQLVDRGAKVAICARTQADLDEAAAELRKRGGQVLAAACDIRDMEQVKRFIGRVTGTWGRIDVLLNVAGVIEVGPLESMTLEDFHEAMDINCYGALHTILAVLPTMKQQRWGRILNVASIGGKQAVPHLLPYDMSKFALVGLSNGLRTDLAKDGIIVTTASPTLMRTGSPRNAFFKGHHRGEYAWFSLGGSLPIVSMNAERAANQILTACQAGDADVFITNLLNPPIWAARLLPTLTTEILSVVNRFLPPPGGIGKRRAWGHDSQSAVSPSLLTTLSDQAAAQNNELHARTASSSP